MRDEQAGGDMDASQGEMTVVTLPGDTLPPPAAGGPREVRVRELHATTVTARAVAVGAPARHAAAEAAFDVALDQHQPMPVLRVLDRELDTAAREARAAQAI